MLRQRDTTSLGGASGSGSATNSHRPSSDKSMDLHGDYYKSHASSDARDRDEYELGLRSEREANFNQVLLKPIVWKDQLNVLLDPYQYIMCNVKRSESRGLSLPLIYSHILYLAKEWRFLSSRQVQHVVEKRDSHLQSFSYNKLGKVAIIFQDQILLCDSNHQPNQRKHQSAAAGSLQSGMRGLVALENEKKFQFLMPSYKFSEILIGSTRNCLYLLKQVNHVSPQDGRVTSTTLETIKEYDGFNAEDGRFSRDGKYFVFSNRLSRNLHILDLFAHKIYSRSTGQTSISSMGFSRSGLNFITVCNESNSVNVFECVLWEKVTFKLDERIVFAGFADDQSGNHAANCVVVLLQSGRVQVLKDMQFNMLNSLERRINFEFVESRQLQVSQLMLAESVANVQMWKKILQAMLVENVLFVLAETQSESGAGNRVEFSYVSLAQAEASPFVMEDLNLHVHHRFYVSVVKNGFEISLFNLENREGNEEDFVAKINVNFAAQRSSNHSAPSY